MVILALAAVLVTAAVVIVVLVAVALLNRDGDGVTFRRGSRSPLRAGAR